MKKIYLLDTNIISEPVKKIPNENVLTELEAHGEWSAISAVAWSEILLGINLMAEGKNKKHVENYALDVINELYEKIPFDDHAATIYADLFADYKKNGLQPPIHDLQIAATAIANNMILVTRNTKDFENIPDLMMENWFEEE